MSRDLELWLIRHGATKWHGTDRLHGQTDVALGALGREQAQRLKAQLEQHSFDIVYSSDLRRAQATAHTALEGYRIILDERLREVAYGSLEGKNKHTLSEAERRTFWGCRDHLYPVPAPEGESWRDMEVRVTAWLKSLPSTGRVIAFTHGGTIRCVVFLLTADPIARDWHVRLANVSLTQLKLYGERAILESFGNTVYLAGTHG